MEIFYRVTNTGNVEIDICYPYFAVLCADGSVYDDCCGLKFFLAPGESAEGWTLEYPDGKQAIEVTVSRIVIEEMPY